MEKLVEIYNRDKKVITEFLDNNHDLPSAVKEALILHLADINGFIRVLDETNTPECAEVASGQNS
ncbi:MAG: hypothetical protein LBC76_07995 [Treponema sp.]|jgi:hypothetical protein|nr:hypothetical protein [Treponema sp.]